MKKKRSLALRAAMPWILAALFTVLCAWIVLKSEAFQACINTPPNESGEQDSIKGIAAIFILGINRYRLCTGEFVHANGESIIAAFTVVLAYSTIGLWASTYKLWLAGEAQSEITREAADAAKVSANTLVSAERAHLWMQRITVHGLTKEGDGPRKIRCGYVIRNVGHSPAFVTDTRTHFHFGTLPDKPTYPDRPDLDSINFVAPGGTGTSAINPLHGPNGKQIEVPPELVEPYRSGKLAMFAYGYIRYRDPLSGEDERFSSFCYRIGFGDEDVSTNCFPEGGSAFWTYT